MCASKYNNYLTENEKTQILFYYNIGWSTTMIGKKLNRSDSSIGRFLNKKNLKPKNNHNGLLDAEIEDIVNLYKAGKTANEILQKYNNKIKCPETIINIVKRNNVDVRPRGITAYFNTRYFNEINSEAKAYYLGLLLTDGNVYKYKKRKADQYKIQLSLKSEDVYIIEKFKMELNSKNKISHYSNAKKDECVFQIGSTEMAKDLLKYGICERKTFIAQLTNLIPKELYRHYIRGVFDGDGTVYINKFGKLKFGFYGTHKLVLQVRNYLISQIGVNENSVYDKETVSFILFSQEKDIFNFYKLMYNDSKFYLKRKKEKFEDYFDKKYCILNANTELTI